MIVALAVVVCLAASSANAAIWRTAPIPVNSEHPDMCLLNSTYVPNGKTFQLPRCREMYCYVNNGFYQFITNTTFENCAPSNDIFAGPHGYPRWTSPTGSREPPQHWNYQGNVVKRTKIKTKYGYSQKL
ncbi:uncharacterized protein LOC143033099 [Oratosquilla oratoria]|uniref:uncharacterized protein LOC143033099 n=1 Tax=Oratosquilla oratoria TaxID=337810 RepID=UPI003F762770